MINGNTLKNAAYYGIYQLLFVVMSVLLASIGAFFHFLLDHEISIVESWLHNNHWEILIISKLVSLGLINYWFKMRLYQLKTFKQLIQELVRWPEPKAVAIALFMLISCLSLGKINLIWQNFGYWYYHLTSYLGLFLFFGIDFLVISYLSDVLDRRTSPTSQWLRLIYTLFFCLAYKLSVPDYYHLMPYVIFCYSTLMYLSGKAFRSWSNVLCFLLLFVAPLGSLFGLDPIWGDDFSPFGIVNKLNVAFLAAIWVISFSYYKYRDQFLNSARKLLR